MKKKLLTICATTILTLGTTSQVLAEKVQSNVIPQEILEKSNIRLEFICNDGKMTTYVNGIEREKRDDTSSLPYNVSFFYDNKHPIGIYIKETNKFLPLNPSTQYQNLFASNLYKEFVDNENNK